MGGSTCAETTWLAVSRTLPARSCTGAAGGGMRRPGRRPAYARQARPSRGRGAGHQAARGAPRTAAPTLASSVAIWRLSVGWLLCSARAVAVVGGHAPTTASEGAQQVDQARRPGRRRWALVFRSGMPDMPRIHLFTVSSPGHDDGIETQAGCGAGDDDVEGDGAGANGRLGLATIGAFVRAGWQVLAQLRRAPRRDYAPAAWHRCKAMRWTCRRWRRQRAPGAGLDRACAEPRLRPLGHAGAALTDAAIRLAESHRRHADAARQCLQLRQPVARAADRRHRSSRRTARRGFASSSRPRWPKPPPAACRSIVVRAGDFLGDRAPGSTWATAARWPRARHPHGARRRGAQLGLPPD